MAIGGIQEAVSPAEAQFERGRKIAGAIAAPIVFALLLTFTKGLSSEGCRLSAVLGAVGILWMTEALPLPVTALVGAAACIVLGVAEAKVVLAPFADPVVFLFIGSFMLARAMALYQLDRRLALGLLSVPWIAAHPVRVMAAFGLVTAFLSMWISNTATTAMMVPIGLGILQALHVAAEAEAAIRLRPAPSQKTYAAGLMLMTAFAASIGGMGTPVGSPPNLIGIGLIRKHANFDVTFFRWMTIAFPICLTMMALLIVLLSMLHPAGRAASQGRELQAYLRQERLKLGPWTPGQRNTLFVLGVAFLMWVVPGVLELLLPSQSPILLLLKNRLPEAVVALIAMLLLFVLPINLKGDFTLTWNEAVRIDWGTVLLFGGGMSLGGLMFSTGVAEALGRAVTAQTGVTSLWGLTAVSIGMAIILSEATSNTAAANMIIPVVIALATEAKINPIPPALGACLGTSFGFMLPVSTPPNAVAYGTGLVSIPKMVRAGILLDLMGFVVIWLGLRLLCPLAGI